MLELLFSRVTAGWPLSVPLIVSVPDLVAGVDEQATATAAIAMPPATPASFFKFLLLRSDCEYCLLIPGTGQSK